MQAGEVIVGIQAIVRFIYPFVLPSLEGRSKHKIAEEKRKLLQDLLLASYPAMSAVKLLPEHNSLVGYLVTTDDIDPDRPKAARRLLEAAGNKIKEFIDENEVEVIKYNEFVARFPSVKIESLPTLVIWATKVEKPLLIIPFYKEMGKLGQVKLDIDEAKERLRELDRERESVLV